MAIDSLNVIATVSDSVLRTANEGSSERLVACDDGSLKCQSSKGRALRTIANIFSFGVYGLIKDRQVKHAFVGALEQARAEYTSGSNRNNDVASSFDRVISRLNNSSVFGVVGNVASSFRADVTAADWKKVILIASLEGIGSKLDEQIGKSWGIDERKIVSVGNSTKVTGQFSRVQAAVNELVNEAKRTGAPPRDKNEVNMRIDAAVRGNQANETAVSQSSEVQRFAGVAKSLLYDVFDTYENY